jgi:hypothetical protein
MIPVIEEKEVVQPTVVADCTPSVFVVTLQITEPKTDEKPWKIDAEQKARKKGKHRRP